jgi:hypothetical protein
MALVLKDRVRETSTTIGTGTITLAGAVSGFQSFSNIGNGNTTYYTIAGGAEWEVGLGTYTSSGNTLSRDTVLSSSNSNSLVNFSAGTKEVFVTYPANKSIYQNASSIANITSLDVTTALGYTPGTATYPSAGIALSTGSAWSTSITDNSSNWNTAYTDRLKWDGGATGLTASTGRTSLGLGTAATMTGPSGTIVGTTDTQTLTNKTINGTSNTISNIGLSTQVTGTLPVDNGGTGVATLTTAYGVLAAGTTATGSLQNIGTGTSAQLLTSNGTGALPTFQDAAASPYVLKNRLLNGSFNVAQRGTSFVSGANDDDTYNLDRWYVLSDGNDAVDITQTTTVPTGAKYSIGLDVETVNKKFGIAQIIENVNCYDAIGGNVTLSFQAKVSATTKLDNVKCAVIAWSGTADTVTSDIISAWEAEGTNPTLIANATYENTPANLNVTTSWATYSVTANVDTASTANIIVFIWSDVTDTTAGDFLHITNAQLEVGTSATPFERRLYNQELANCQRYYQKYSAMLLSGYNATSGVIYNTFLFPVELRATPTINYSTFTNSNCGNASTNAVNNKVLRVQGTITATGSGFSIFNADTSGAEL